MKRLIRTNGQEAQSFMFSQKIKFVWFLNLVLFVGVVYMGIQQASRGADINDLENKLEITIENRNRITEEVFLAGNIKNSNTESSLLGYVKPEKIFYFDSIDSVASIR